VNRWRSCSDLANAGAIAIMPPTTRRCWLVHVVTVCTRLLSRAQSAGALRFCGTPRILDYLHKRCHLYTNWFGLTEARPATVGLIRDTAWMPSYDADGQVRRVGGRVNRVMCAAGLARRDAVIVGKNAHSSGSPTPTAGG
jgi:hypothetical protein